MSPVRAPLRSSSALVAVVVPCTITSTSAALRRGAGQRALHAAGLVGHRGRHLGHPHLAGGLVDEHQIGEGPADVDPDELGLVRA